MKLALLQLRSTDPSPSVNVEAALKWVDRVCDSDSPDLIVLPEFFNTTYFPQYPEVSAYWHLAEGLDGPAVAALRASAKENDVEIVAGIYEKAGKGLHFDTAIFIDRTGKIRDKYRKIHAPAILGGYEKLYYTPGSEYIVVQSDTGWRVGLLICYDWRFPEASRILAASGADVIVMPFATPPMNMWREALATRAWENQLFVAACNRVGQDGEWRFSGESLICSPLGEVIASGGSATEESIVASLSLDLIEDARRNDFNWRDRRPDTYGPVAETHESLLRRGLRND